MNFAEHLRRVAYSGGAALHSVFKFHSNPVRPRFLFLFARTGSSERVSRFCKVTQQGNDRAKI